MKEPSFVYTIEVDEFGYSELLRLVMRFGTGAAQDGMGTAANTRLALAEATIRRANHNIDEAA